MLAFPLGPWFVGQRPRDRPMVDRSLPGHADRQRLLGRGWQAEVAQTGGRGRIDHDRYAYWIRSTWRPCLEAARPTLPVWAVAWQHFAAWDPLRWARQQG